MLLMPTLTPLNKKKIILKGQKFFILVTVAHMQYLLYANKPN